MHHDSGLGEGPTCRACRVCPRPLRLQGQVTKVLLQASASSCSLSLADPVTPVSRGLPIHGMSEA